MARIWRELENDNNLALLAPRRVGKTSLMRRLRDDAPSHGYNAVYVSLQGVVDEDGVIQYVLNALSEHPEGAPALEGMGNIVASFFRRVKKLNVGPLGMEMGNEADDWRTMGDKLLKHVASRDGRWLFLIDELPLVVLALIRSDPDSRRARDFLDWFRDLRIGATCEHVRWVLAGSVGLDSVTRRQRMSDTINDLTAITGFGPFTPEVADDFLVALAESAEITLPIETRARVLEKAEWLIPYHIQLLFSELVASARRPFDAQAVDEAYASLLRPEHRNYFDWWHQRLFEELGPVDAAHAASLLTIASQDPRGVPEGTLRASLFGRIPDSGDFDALFSFITDLLQSDGYLVEDEGRFRFRSPLLRDYWHGRIR